jgi:hypothetical protein
VGQATGEANYRQRQYIHKRNNPNADYEFIELERIPQGSDRFLDVAEEDWIRAGGGPKRHGGRLENDRYEINDIDYRATGGEIDYPPEAEPY